MSRQIPEAIYQSALRMDPPSILAFCRTNKQYNRDLCNNETFWTDKLIIDFGNDPLFNKANQAFNDDVSNKMKYQIFYKPEDQDIEDSIQAESYDLTKFLINGKEDWHLYVIETLEFLGRYEDISYFGRYENLDSWTTRDFSHIQNVSAFFIGKLRRYIKSGNFDAYSKEILDKYAIMNGVSLFRKEYFKLVLAGNIIIALEKSLDYMDDDQVNKFINKFTFISLSKYISFYNKYKRYDDKVFELVRRLRKMISDKYGRMKYSAANDLLYDIEVEAKSFDIELPK